MNIAIHTGEINSETVQTVNARDLHEFLEVGKDFSNWIRDRISQYGFQVNVDYVEVYAETGENSSGGRPRKNYHISLDMAKELSMVERNEKGKQARQYFIECERRAKLPMSEDQVILIAMQTLNTRVEALQIESHNKDVLIGQMQPKVEEYDAYLNTEGVTPIRDFCNKHQVKVRHPGWALRDRGMLHQKRTVATQKGIKAGIVKNIVDRNSFEYIDSRGNSVEAQSAMIVKQREADLLKILVTEYGKTAFRNEVAFARAQKLIGGAA